MTNSSSSSSEEEFASPCDLKDTNYNPRVRRLPTEPRSNMHRQAKGNDMKKASNPENAKNQTPRDPSTNDVAGASVIVPTVSPADQSGSEVANELSGAQMNSGTRAPKNQDLNLFNSTSSVSTKAAKKAFINPIDELYVDPVTGEVSFKHDQSNRKENTPASKGANLNFNRDALKFTNFNDKTAAATQPNDTLFIPFVLSDSSQKEPRITTPYMNYYSEISELIKNSKNQPDMSMFLQQQENLIKKLKEQSEYIDRLQTTLLYLESSGRHENPTKTSAPSARPPAAPQIELLDNRSEKLSREAAELTKRLEDIQIAMRAMRIPKRKCREC